MKFLSLDRTKAAPLPGLTWRNSTELVDISVVSELVDIYIYILEWMGCVIRTHYFVGSAIELNCHSCFEIIGRDLCSADKEG